MSVPGYAYEAPAWLKFYDTVMKRARRGLVRRYDAALVDELTPLIRAEFASLLPQIPYIGPDNVWKLNLISSGMYLAVYRVMQRRGEPLEKAVRLIYDTMESVSESFPAFLRRMYGRYTLSRFSRASLRNGALASQEKKYPGDWVFKFVEKEKQKGKNKKPTFDFGVDITECAIKKFYKAQGAFELLTYVCKLDYFMGKALGYRFTRTGTLADGQHCCDCRYWMKGETTEWPPVLP